MPNAHRADHAASLAAVGQTSWTVAAMRLGTTFFATVASAVLLLAVAWGWWQAAPAAGQETRIVVLALALSLGFGVYFASRQPTLIGLKLGIFSALLMVCGTEIWLSVGREIAAGHLSARTVGTWFAARQRGWETLFLLLGPVPGILLGAMQTPSLVFTAFASRAGLAGARRRAKSDLYGKAEFMSRRDRRTLEHGRGLLLGQTSSRRHAPLISWPLEGSAITLAPPRTGKGATIALNLLSPDDRGPQGSTIVIDPRGETYCIVARRRRQMGRNVLLVDPFGMVAAHAARFPKEIHLPMTRSEQYNPLDFIRDTEAEAVRDIGVLLDALLTPPTSDTQNTSQHFYQSAREIITGYIAWVRFQETDGKRNLEQVRALLSRPPNTLEAFRKDIVKAGPFCGDLALKAIERRLSVSPDEAGSQSSTIANQLSFLAQPGLLKNTTSSTFDPAVISDGNTDLFIVVPDDMVGEVRNWVRLWITIPNAIPNRAALTRDLLLVIDEMPRLGYLKPVMDAYNLAAGKGVHFWCFAQSISSLESTWGKEPTRTLIDLAELVQVLGFPRTDARGAEEFAKAIGQATFESSSESLSGTVSEQRALMASTQVQMGESTQLVREYLVPPDDLMTMAPNEQYIIAAGKTVSRNALHLYHARYWERDDVRHHADPNPFVVRKSSGGLSAPTLSRDEKKTPAASPAEKKTPPPATTPPLSATPTSG